MPRVELKRERWSGKWIFGAATWPWGWCWMLQFYLGPWTLSFSWDTRMRLSSYQGASAFIGQWLVLGADPWFFGVLCEGWRTYTGWMGGLDFFGLTAHIRVPLPQRWRAKPIDWPL